jgi:hypothetical protein
VAKRHVTVDGNEAAARIAHMASEVIAIYPITPSSPMGELADAWSTAGRPNLWGAVPEVVEMQSEGGARSSSRAEGEGNVVSCNRTRGGGETRKTGAQTISTGTSPPRASASATLPRRSRLAPWPRRPTTIRS